jgi:predicted CXXCH cytochrome family protein
MTRRMGGSAALVLLATALSPLAALQGPANVAVVPTPIGARACATCHARQHDAWQDGRHSKMLQAARPGVVLGDFSQGALALGGRPYRLREEDGGFYVTESDFAGRADGRRIQHYLTTIDRGRIVVLPPTWDVQRRLWFDNRDIVRPETTASDIVQQWNRNCVGCHVSGQDNRYSSASRTYDTTWTDFGTSCERCHAPGSEHARLARTGASAVRDDPVIVRPTRLDAAASTAICAQCHSWRDPLAPAFRAGESYDDHFIVKLEYGPLKKEDPTYWADGRPRRFSNDAVGLWQSQCYVKGGLTCVDCHDAHTPDVDRSTVLAPANSALCTRCHTALAAEVSAHTRHAATSAGSACVECHMPKTVTSIKATMRDHTIGLPTPENTVAYGIPNACTACHTTKSARWAVDTMRRWWPEGRRKAYIDRAGAFTAARRGRPDALPKLLALAADAASPPLVRANALGYLRSSNDPRAVSTLTGALASPHPVERMVAASSLGEFGAPATLLGALRDPSRAVRVSALVSLVSAGTGALGPDDRVAFARVSQEFADRATLHEDDAATQTDLGLVRLLNNDHTRAAAALDVALGLDPAMPRATYLLGLARLGQGRLAEARSLFGRVPVSDPVYRLAQDELARLSGGRQR